MTPPVLRLAGVTKRFKPPLKGMPQITALHEISFDLMAGKTLGLVGPDGSGKTTLMRAMAGLAQLDSGTIEVLGHDVSRIDRSQVGYMPQSGALYLELSVAENLALYARLRNLEPSENGDRIDHVYRLTGLADFQHRRAGQLSGGMRQKLALACAVVAAPPLMLLDEPSVGVDPVSRREIWQLARELATPETSIVWGTSILEDAELCDEIIVLHEGRLHFGGPPTALSAKANGRVYFQTVPLEERRTKLRAISAEPDTITAKVEGGGLRIVLRNRTENPDLQSVPAHASEGFAVLLDNGQPMRASPLARAFPLVSQDAEQAPAIVAVGLTKRYGTFVAANDISFAVYPGEIFGLLGPNGAGKSTTFRMLCGLVSPTSGYGVVAGQQLGKAKYSARQAMGYMPQKFSLYADLSVEANLRFVAGAYGLNPGQISETLERAVDALELGPFLKTATSVLPLGVRQRVSLAAAVLHSPTVLFLDEPTSGVDPLLRREFWHHINAIAARGVAVLVTTHFMDEAENCDRLLLINQAESIAQGTPDELKQRGQGAKPHESLEDAFIALILSQRERAQEPA